MVLPVGSCGLSLSCLVATDRALCAVVIEVLTDRGGCFVRAGVFRGVWEETLA